MNVTPSGMITDFRSLQPVNAQAPMAVTPFGIVTDVRALGLDSNVDRSFVYSTPPIEVND